MINCLLFNASDRVWARQAGPYRIAHYLREHNWQVEVIDYALVWSLEELQQVTKSRIDQNTKFIGFSHLFSDAWSDILETFCAWLKKEYPTVVLISGSGSAPKFKSLFIDYYVQGFGEHGLMELLKWLFSNGSRPRFNLITIDNAKLITANEQYPAYPMKSLMIKYEDRDFIEPNEWLTIEFSRGCKFACAFCNFPILGVKGDYTRDADDFKEHMIDAYDRFGVTQYVSADDTFNDRTEKITKFADVVETLPFTPFYSGFIRADLLISRPRDREELLRMNFLAHHYGIESFNHNALKAIGKGMHPDKVKEGLVDIRNYFRNNGRKLYRNTSSFIVGLPGETKQDIQNTFSWIRENYKGESFLIYPLEIPTGQLDANSKLSINYRDYGYTDMNDPNVEILNSNIVLENAKHTSALRRDGTIFWQNEHMNYMDAQNIVNNFYSGLKQTGGDYKIPMWMLPRYHPTMTLEEKLNCSMLYQTDGEWYDASKAKEKIYKDKKLNL
jgi:radical SAM superfamily enzyme YgiQ (UPF0313 family)